MAVTREMHAKPMPGFTKAQLVEKALDPKQYAWCKRCRLYWSKRSLAKHRHARQSGEIVKIDMPSMRKPKKGDVVIINPAFEKFIDALAELVITDLLRNPQAREAEKKTKSLRGARVASHSEPEYDVLTVDQAAARLGVSRAEIMAALEKAATTQSVPIEVLLK